jgi:hypothetical protein
MAPLIFMRGNGWRCGMNQTPAVLMLRKYSWHSTQNTCNGTQNRHGFWEEERTTVSVRNQTPFAILLTHSEVTIVNGVFRLPQCDN